MKKTFFILLVCMCWISSACDKDADDSNTKIYALVYFDSEGGTETVVLSDLDNIELTGYPEWLTVSSVKEDGMYIYKATVSKNESTEMRKTSIWYKYREKNSTSESSGNIIVIQFGTME
jgi:hypothetical protein